MNKINKKELHEIFENLRKKEQGAYNKLYENYYKLVYAIVFSILKNKDDSEDVTHEIFTKIYKLDVNKLPTNNESSWLFTVSKNECYSYLRKSKPNINIDEMFEIAESSSDIDKIIDVEYYNNLISGLKEDEKLIVSLKVLSNFTFSKISQIMNIPIGTVQWKYYKAINSLKVSISSLVGAVIAFVIVFARRESLNNKEYLNEKDDYVGKDENYLEDFEQDEEAKDNEESNKTDDNYINVEGNKNDNIATNESINNNSTSEDATNENSSIKNEQTPIEIPTGITQTDTSSIETKMNRIDNIQATFTIIGIICLIFFIIFFKIYQQKLRKKSSK